MKRTRVRWYSPEDARNTANLASLGYVYSINSPTSRPTMFATHVDLRSAVPFRFGTDDWLRLSPSDPYHRYLAVNQDGSDMSFRSPSGDPVRRVVPVSAIVLTEYRADEQVYVAHVPRLDPYAELAGDDAGDPLDLTHPGQL